MLMEQLNLQPALSLVCRIKTWTMRLGATVFSKNRQRLLVATLPKRFEAILKQARRRNLLSDSTSRDNLVSVGGRRVSAYRG